MKHQVERRLRTSVVCVHSNKILVFRAVDPHSGKEYFFLPGGKIEDGEDRRVCAERETLEETGYKVRVSPRSEVRKEYIFRWNNKDYFCKTHFFKADLLGDPQKPNAVHDADYNKGAEWIPVSEASKIFTYHRAILLAVMELLED